MSRSADLAATPLPALKCWENNGKLVCDSVAVAVKIRFLHVTFFGDQTKIAIPRGYRKRTWTECSTTVLGTV